MKFDQPTLPSAKAELWLKPQFKHRWLLRTSQQVTIKTVAIKSETTAPITICPSIAHQLSPQVKKTIYNCHQSTAVFAPRGRTLAPTFETAVQQLCHNTTATALTILTATRVKFVTAWGMATRSTALMTTS